MTTPTYQLQSGKSTKTSYREFLTFLKGEHGRLVFATIAILINSGTNMISPFLISKAVDSYISVGNVQGLLTIVYILSGAYLITFFVGYVQGILVGKISQNVLFRLREALFAKLQHLPIAFFNQNKSGDLMSRINNDTDKINQFLSQSISQFIGTMFTLIGVLVFTFVMSVKLTLVMISAIVFLYVITKAISPWIQKQNRKNLEAVGGFSASLQENLTNFRIVAAYSKRDYLEKHLTEANQKTFKTALTSGVGNRIFEPIYDFAGAAALIAVLSYGFHLVGNGEITIGILIAFVAYTQRFYDPMRFLATIFGTIQMATAAWGRVHEVFSLKSNIRTPDDNPHAEADTVHAKSDLRMELKDVSFAYEGGDPVIEDANLQFAKGKTYALVGPTGGGKSTLASLMAHLYDPTVGTVYLNGKNICSYTHAERAAEISVILQDPILFNGTVGENIRYGNMELAETSIEDLNHMLESKGFKDIIGRFESGLETKVNQNGAGLSIGQKQLISFMRAILREPKLLILDEATANIDTVTEALLNKTLESLSPETTKIIIAHRLNTIKEADEIMFVNGHHVTPAGSFENAIKLIADAKRSS